LDRGLQALTPEEFEKVANESSALILDTRSAAEFSNGFIPNSINIGIDGNFAPWVGALIPDIRKPILLVAAPGREEEVVTRLARVGYDQTLGYLKGGFESWAKEGKEIDRIQSISADQLAELAPQMDEILDVRKTSEYTSEHIVGVENLPLDYINDEIGKLDKDKTYYVHCAGGYRSMIFASILKARGYEKIIDVKGGFKAIKESTKFPISDFVCPTTQL